MRGTYITALVITGAVAIWLLSGWLTAEEGVSEHPSLAQANALAGGADDKAPTAVRAKVIHARTRPEQISVRGRTENKPGDNPALGLGAHREQAHGCGARRDPGPGCRPAR